MSKNIFTRYKTLKELSLDNEEYMTESDIQAIDGDAFIKYIHKKEHWRDVPHSCDAFLYYQREYFFIEFKNGKLENEKETNIRAKAWNSLTIFCKIYQKSIEEVKNRSQFILVYNEDKNVKELLRQKRNHLTSLPEIDPKNLKYFLEGLYFKIVQTLSKQEFETQFARNTR
jgi:hypothetical protein